MKKLFLLDASGSLSVTDEKEYAQEIKNIIKFSQLGTSDFLISHCDEHNGLSPIKEVNLNNIIDAKTKESFGYGTDLNSSLKKALELSKENKIDTIYFLTDLYANVAEFKTMDIPKSVKVEIITPSSTDPNHVKEQSKIMGKSFPIYQIRKEEPEQEVSNNNHSKLKV